MYHGQGSVKPYLTQPRAAGAEVDSGAVYHGNRIVVLVHARVRPKGSNHGQDVSLADVCTFRNGRVVEMQAFAGRRETLRWVGAEADRVQ
jgi:hypothetical protein